MSILNVNQIQPVGGGNTITVSASDVSASGATITATSFVGSVTGDITGNITGASATFSGNVDIADKIIHTGDTDTAIRFPADNTFAVDTAGSERLRITSDGDVNVATGGLNVTNGSVGIGTDITPADLSITQQNPNIRFDDSDTTNNAEITLDNTQLRLEVDEDNSTASSQIRFRVDGTNRAILDSNGNFKIENGNLVFSTSGTGIDFSATANSSGTMSSEVLDDYEEGTFTPVWGSTSAAYSSPAPTYSTQNGHYTKIGNVVYYDIHLTTTAWNSAGAVMWIYGLPYTTRSSLYQQGGGSIFCIEGVDSQDAISNLTTQIAPNKTNIELYYQTPSAGANYTSFGTGNVSEGNQVNIRVSGFYYTNS